MRTLLTILTLIGLLACCALAADVTGKYKADIPGRDGQTREQFFNLKAEGEKLTGTISSQMGETAISDGKISGDEISFNVVRERDGNTMKMIYTGKVAGDEIKFVMQMEGRDMKREFVAKKVQ
jgi:hypothetical protein